VCYQNLRVQCCISLLQKPSICSLVLNCILFLGNGKSASNGFCILIFRKIFAIILMKELEGQNIGHSAMVDCQFWQDCWYPYRQIKGIAYITGSLVDRKCCVWLMEWQPVKSQPSRPLKEQISSELCWMSIEWGMEGSNNSKETINKLGRKMVFCFLLLEWSYKGLHLSFWLGPV
jgi:hypothetical protein